MSVYETVDRAFRGGGICLDKNDLIFMVMNTFANPSSLPEFYDERVEIFLNILSKNTHLFLDGRIGRSLYFQRKTNYPDDLQDKIGAFWCFTELFYLYRQYLDAEKSDSYKIAKDHLDELSDLSVDVELVSGKGRPNQIAFFGLANILKEVFAEFDLQGMEVSTKFKLATGRFGYLDGKNTRLDAKRMAMLAASIFCVDFSDRIFEVKTEIRVTQSYLHPYFHELMSIKNRLSGD